MLILGVLGCRSSSPSKQTSFVDGTVVQHSNGAVYVIAQGKKHHIPDPPSLNALGVAGSIVHEPDAAIDSVPLGDPIPSLPGKVIQKARTGEVFVLEAGKRRWVPDVETLKAMHLSDQVHGVADAAVDVIPLGPPLPHMKAE